MRGYNTADIVAKVRRMK